MILLAESGGAFDAGFFLLIAVIVSIFMLVFVLVFIRKKTFPMFHLLLIRIFRGKYSDQYLEFFKNNDLRNPLNNCIRDEITLHFSFFYKRLNNAMYFKTETLINEFKNTPFLIHYRQLIKLFGTPHCINIARFNQYRVKVVGYSEPFQQRKMKSLFYFIEDHLVMGEYVFSESHRIDPTSIREALVQKYLGGDRVIADTFYIECPSGNMINFHDNGFYASVKYLCRSDERVNTIIESVFPGGVVAGQAFRKSMIQEEMINRF